MIGNCLMAWSRVASGDEDDDLETLIDARVATQVVGEILLMVRSALSKKG